MTVRASEPAARRSETFSYLPPFTADELALQIDSIIRGGLIPAIEYTRRPRPRDHYWTMWKLPLFSARTAREVQAELAACRTEHPDCHVRLIGYDSRRQCQVVAFVVHRPDAP